MEVEVSSRSLSTAKARKFDGAVWTRIELCSCQSLKKPGASLLVYTTALVTKERCRARQASWCSLVESGGCQELSRARYLVCKRSSRLMSSKREGIVRPIASKSAIALHLGFPIHKGALFLFLHVKVRFAIAKTLLATNKEQPKPASTGKCTLDTKKQ